MIVCSVRLGNPENVIRGVIGVNMSKELGQKDCFVALFDILGFSELVRKNELGRVANTYSRAKKVFKEMLSYVNALNKGFKKNVTVKYRSFSDTFLIYTSTANEDDFDSLLAACDGLFIGAIENRLLIRGAVTCGELIISAGVEIGKPIVDAYNSEQKEDWSGCWITEKCISKINITSYLKDGSVVKYKIPLKDGEVKMYFALNWVKSLTFKTMFKNRRNDFTLEQIKDQIRFINDKYSNWAIRRKLDNTNRFVDFVLSSKFIKAYKAGITTVRANQQITTG